MNVTVPLPSKAQLRPDLAAIAEMIPEGARVLDIGCGDGDLLDYLGKAKNVDGRGLELIQSNVNQCVTRGLSVVQGDADRDLDEYPSGVFEIVILSQTIQATRKPDYVLKELLRIGKRIVVSFPNFGYWRVRASLLLKGRMPVTRSLGDSWYDTPNIHLCTISDFLSLTKKTGARIEKALALDGDGNTRRLSANAWKANVFAEGAIFLLAKA